MTDDQRRRRPEPELRGSGFPIQVSLSRGFPSENEGVSLQVSAAPHENFQGSRLPAGGAPRQVAERIGQSGWRALFRIRTSITAVSSVKPLLSIPTKSPFRNQPPN